MTGFRHRISLLLTKYYWLLLAFIFLLLRLPSLFEPNWYGDEGIYLAIGQTLRHGLLLYTQVHDNKPPSLYLLAAVAQTVFGFRLLLLLVMVPTLYYFYRLALHFLDKKNAKIALFLFLILTSIPFLEGTIANAEVFMLLPTILGVLLFFAAQRWQDYLLSGLLLGLAFTIKIPVFAEMGFLGVWLIISSRSWSYKIKNALVFIIGCLFPIILFGIYFLLRGNFNDFIFAALLQNFGYLSSWSTGSHQSSFLQGGLFSRLIVLLFVWGLLALFHFKKYFKDKYLFLLFWFAATIFATLLSGRPYPHYLIQTLPPFCLLLALLLVPKIRYTKLIIGTALVVFISLIFKFKFYFYPVLSYYRNFYTYAVGLTNLSSYDNFFGNRVSLDNQIAAYLKSQSSPADSIFVWGDEPFLYPQSDRLPTGRFLVAYHIVDFNRYQETMDQLKIKFPKFIVTYPMPGRHFPALNDFMNRYYQIDKVFDSVIVYRRR